MSEQPKPTVLYEEHIRAGARMTPFGPWLLPCHFAGILPEHKATRTQAGLFDTCHMGEIGFAGPGALPTLERVFTRSVESIPPGAARYGFLTMEEGTVVDDCVLYVMPDDFAPPTFMLCINAGDINKVLAWLRTHAEPETVIEDLSSVTGKIDIQGPAARDIFHTLLGREISLKRFEFTFVEAAGVTLMVSRSGYTGEDGYECFSMGGGVVSLWQRLLEAGQPAGLVPCGLGARDTLRIEASLPLYGHELSDTITPLEAGFDWALCWEKPFLGRDALLAQKTAGPSRRIVPFQMAGRAPARMGYPVLADGREIGVVTSGTYLPSLEGAGGLCLIQSEWAREGQSVDILIREQHHKAVICARPLYQKEES